MQMSLILTLVAIPLTLAVAAAIVYLVYLLIRALRKYLRSGEVRQENREAVESLAKALKGHRERCRMTQEFVAEAVGVSRQAVSKWETGDSLPDAQQFISLCGIYGVSDVHRVFRSKECSEDPFYGLNRVGMERANEYISMLRENPSFSHQAKITRIRRQIPLYDMPASAGSGVFLDSDSYTLIDVDENVPEAATLAVRISGDSMTPLFNDGQIVYVHHQQELENGEIGIFVLNGEAFCKKLDSESGSVRLISLNPKYQPIKIKYSYELRVIGKVVG